VNEDDKVTYLKSSAGSIGMMQINQYVWRGFYEIERLKWDVPYNVHAGAEILMRYLKSNAIPLAESTGQVEHIPRATYCVYNAGPKAVRRFLNNKGSARARAVDERFWKLYRGIATGGTVDLQQCGVVSSSG
jgi:soluble lytic murein transglycosylase-like protein